MSARTTLRLFLGTWLVIALMTKATPESAHEYSRLGTVESLVERSTYRLDESIFVDTIDKIYRGGHFYSHQTPLLATLESPVYWLLRVSGARFNNRGRLVLTYCFTLFTNGVAFALTVIVFARVLAMAGLATPWRELLALLLMLGTWLLPYALVPNNHGISGFLLAAVVYLLLQIAHDGMTKRRAVALGAAAGLLAAIELLPLVSFIPLIVIYLFTRRDVTWPMWRIIAATALMPIVAQCVINIRITGDVIPAGFHHELFDYPGSPFTPQVLTGTAKFTSATATARYAWATLFAERGHFTFAPILLLGLIAGSCEWRWWARARGVQLVLIGGVLSSLAASVLTTNQFGGAAVGFRHAAYLAPALLALLLPWLSTLSSGRHWKGALVLAIAAGSAISIVLFATPAPWSALTLDGAAIASPTAYAPVIAQTSSGTLLRP